LEIEPSGGYVLNLYIIYEYVNELSCQTLVESAWRASW
jgi:hypothetical protein